MQQFPPNVQTALDLRGVSPDRQALLTPEEAFQEYCEWHGLIFWSKDLWDTVQALSKLTQERSPHKSKLCVSNIKAQIEAWLRAERTSSLWFERDRLSVYLRRSHRGLGGQIRQFLDVANITSHDEGKGHCRAFFQMIEGLPFDGIYVENVLNPILESALLRWGYKVDPASATNHSPCFFKSKDKDTK